jgi:hypothetical protein
MILLPNITYNVQEALDYYTTLKNNYQHLKWTKNEWLEFCGVFSGQFTDAEALQVYEVTKDTFKSDKPKEEIIAYLKKHGPQLANKFTENVEIWMLKEPAKSHPKITEELIFGFAKKVLDIFPTATTFEVVVNQPGVKYFKHTDKADFFKIFIPIIADEGAVWQFDHVSNLPTPPGHAYLLERHKPHGTDTFGPNERVTLSFHLTPDMFDEVLNMKIAI